MSSISDNSVKKSPLDAAQKIVAELAGMTSEHQSLALKFTIETLGLQLPAALSQVAGTPDPSAQPTSSRAASSTGHSTDIKSFTALKAPQSDQQFVAVVAYFYHFEAPADSQKNSIDATIMKDAARLAGRKQVSNWNATLNNALRSGYLDRTEQQGAFKLSAVGENLVAITLPGNGVSGQSKSNSANKKSKKKSSKKSIEKKK